MVKRQEKPEPRFLMNPLKWCVMPGYMLTFIVATLLALNVAAQDNTAVEESEAESTSEAEEVGAADAEVAEEVDDADLDEQTYEDDDDGFVPTEEIPADEAIPFPTNI